MVILSFFYVNYISIIIKKAFDIFLPCSEVGFLRDWQVGGSWVQVPFLQMIAAAPESLSSSGWLQRNWTKSPDHKTNISPLSGGSGRMHPDSKTI